MALDFPSSPSLNQIISSEGLEYIWNGTAWVGYSSEISYPQANLTNIDAVNIDVTGITTSLNLDVTNGTIDYLIASQANISGTTTSLTLDVTNGTIDYFTSSQTNVLGIASALNLDVTNGSVDYLTSTQANVSGTTTSLNLDVTNGTVDYLTATQANVSGVVTATTFDGNVTGNLSGNVNSSGVSTFSNVVVGGATTELVVTGDARITGILTIGTSSITLNGIDNTIKIGTGLTLTESGNANYAGFVTALAFFGDGTNIDISQNPDNGVGLSTVGGVVGYAVTHINLFGTSISTSTYNSSSGIATVYINGGNVPIGDTFPSSAKNGDLFYNIDYGRTYIYYDEVALGVGLAAFWVDAAPFNNIIEANYALVAGIATYAPVAGIATVAGNLTGGPNVQVGRIRATGITTFERNSEFQQDVRIDGTLRVGTGVTINSGVVTASSFDGNITTTQITVVPENNLLINVEGMGQPYTYTFGSGGIVNFPSNIEIGSGGYSFFEDGGVDSTIQANPIHNFKIHVGGYNTKVWSFSTDGSLSTPGDIIVSSGSVGIGTTNATSTLTVHGDVSVGIDTSKGVILTSENGTRYRLIVGNDGSLSTTAV
jgi:hypothetical protein